MTILYFIGVAAVSLLLGYFLGWKKGSADVTFWRTQTNEYAKIAVNRQDIIRQAFELIEQGHGNFEGLRKILEQRLTPEEKRLLENAILSGGSGGISGNDLVN